MSDKSHPEPITTLVAGEHELRSAPRPWNRTRRDCGTWKSKTTNAGICCAKREFGDDPADAKVRDARTAEGHVG